MGFCVDARGVVLLVGDAHGRGGLLGEILTEGDKGLEIVDPVIRGRIAIRPYI